MIPRATRLALGSLVLILSLGSGCQNPAPPKASARTSAVLTDACADRLHEVCGELLLYYFDHRELPATAEELHSTTPLVCPVCNKPYTYNAAGLFLPGWPGRLVMYDSTPCHGGARWGILAEPPQSGKPLVVRVILPPEAMVQRQIQLAAPEPEPLPDTQATPQPTPQTQTDVSAPKPPRPASTPLK